MCGDATSRDDLEHLTCDHRPDVIYTDPPYGINITKRSNGRFKKYRPVIGDNSTSAARAAYALTADLCPLHVWWGANHYADALPDSRCWLFWDKQTNGGFADGELAWTNFNRPVRKFTHRWNGFQKDSERGQARIHPTQKPAALLGMILDSFSKDHHFGIVLDLFGGSGSTLIGCEDTDRTCLMMELDPFYIDRIIERWQTHTSGNAVLLTGSDPVPYDELRRRT